MKIFLFHYILCPERQSFLGGLDLTIGGLDLTVGVISFSLNTKMKYSSMLVKNKIKVVKS